SHSRVVDRAGAVWRLWPELGGGEAGKASRLFGFARDLARLDDCRWAMAGPSASSSLAASAAPAARLPGRPGADRRLGARLVRGSRPAVHGAGFCGVCDEPVDAAAVCWPR